MIKGEITMTQEEKELLLKDLSARLPYKVVMNVTEPGDDRVNFNCFLGPDIIKEIESETGHFKYKPYLRPMSSMTEEEINEFNNLVGYEDNNGWIRCNNLFGNYGIDVLKCSAMFDWLNSHHFDYCGLIEKDLAIEAPEGMYNIK